jgi:hypothetical protein
MEIHEIESLSFAELKERRDELTEAAKAESPDVLAVRYLKALTSAKQRDEKLGEQGRMITALQDGLEAAKHQTATAAKAVEEQVRRADALVADLESLRTSAREVAIADKAAIEALHQTVARETARADRLKVEATRNHQAVAQAAKILADALGAQAVDAAETGE